MKFNVRRSAPFNRDFAAILRYFLEQNAEQAGDRFADAVEEALDAIAMMPNMGHPWEIEATEEELRYWIVKRFENYLIFYRQTEHELLIERIFHASQNIAAELSRR